MHNTKELLASLLVEVWRNIDWERVSPTRRMRVYDEMTTKLRRASRVRTMEDMVSKLCRLWGIESLRDTELLATLEGLSHEEKEEMLKWGREDAQYIVWLMKAKIEEAKEAKEKKEAKGLF